MTVELPTIAHVHVGHAITGWTDTPDGSGLCTVALAEAATAVEHARYAVESVRAPVEQRLHLGHVLHAVDPTRERAGPGTGYGLIHALAGCTDHLGYAVDVPDASDNLRTGLAPLLAVLQPLGVQARRIAALAAQGRLPGDDGVTLAYAHDVRQRCAALREQLESARTRLTQVLAAENPPYRPLARRYLFGIVRLQDGSWAWAPSVSLRPHGAHR